MKKVNYKILFFIFFIIFENVNSDLNMSLEIMDIVGNEKGEPIYLKI